MRHLIALAALGSLVACGKGDGEDWTKKPIKTVTGTVKGVAFSIDIPDGMRMKAEPDRVEFDFKVGDYVKTPNISIGEGTFADTLDKFVETEKSVDNWVKKEPLPDGYIATYENSSYKGREDYLIYAVRKFGDKTLSCSVRVTPWTKGATVKEKLPLLEKACLSLKAT